jgi:hypothetical protein
MDISGHLDELGQISFHSINSCSMVNSGYLNEFYAIAIIISSIDLFSEQLC